MQTSQNTSNTESCNIFQRIWAAFVFLTRLPLWRLYQPPKKAYESVVEFWPLTGWLTASISALVLYLVAPHSLILAPLAVIIVRVLLTGALHEDGLADFFDGFGAGGEKQRILTIMKDSHIGTYGVIALILYFLTLFVCLSAICSINISTYGIFVILMADPFAKMLASQTIILMPYARKEDESKAKNIYRKPKLLSYIFLLLQGLIPLGFFIFKTGITIREILPIIILPIVICTLLNLLIYKKLKGYTGDCNGAVFLLTELSVYLTALFVL